MQRNKTYKLTKRNLIGPGLVFVVLLWCNAGFVLWNAARKISYEYVRSHRSEIKFRDTIIVATESLKGSAELVWMKHDEIRYQNQMFDIKQQFELDGGQTMLVGHYDKWENKLFKSLENLLDTGSHKTPQKNRQTVLWLCEAVMPQPLVTYRSFFVEPLVFNFPGGKDFYSLYQPDIPSPPPDAHIA